MMSFWREMRRRHDVLMDDGQPAGGKWNYDAENRRGFGKRGPGSLPPPPAFTPDAITREVLKLVEREFPQHPGDLSGFDWPVTAGDAEAMDGRLRFVADKQFHVSPFFPRQGRYEFRLTPVADNLDNTIPGQAQVLYDRICIGNNIPVCNHHSLGLAGGP